jgi:hypothetical protein
MTVFAPRFTSHDPQVEEWWENQRVKSKSLELAIKLLVRQYGTVDIYDAAVTSLMQSLTSTDDSKQIVTYAPKVITPKKSVEPKPKKKEEPKKVDPEDLITASEKPTVAKPSTQELSPDDILAMMSNQAGSL